MEFLRFGSSIPGSYWGCCAVCVIQNFKVDPDDSASIQLVNGDDGQPVLRDGGFIFAGPTYKDIFLQRLRIGTFNQNDMPNHAFLAVLTDYQLKHDPGKKWLKILKEQGFEFIRTVDNSVYSGDSVIGDDSEGLDEYGDEVSSHPNHIFGLFRNIGTGAVKDPFTPPKEWTDLPSVVPEVWQTMFSGVESNIDRGSLMIDLHSAVQAAQLPLYNALPKNKWMTEHELESAGVTVTYAGIRSKFNQQSKQEREALKELKKGATKAAPAPFSASAV